MNVFHILMISAAIHLCKSNDTNSENQSKLIFEKKLARDVEAFTTILLDDEAFSIAQEAKHPKNQPNSMQMKHKAKLPTDHNLLKSIKQNVKEMFKPQGEPHAAGVNPENSMQLSKNTAVEKGKGVHTNRNNRQYMKRTNILKKKIHKKRFVGENRNYRKVGEKHKYGEYNGIGQTHRYVLSPADSHASREQFGSKPKKPYKKLKTKDSHVVLEENLPKDKDDSEDFTQNPPVQLEDLEKTDEYERKEYTEPTERIEERDDFEQSEHLEEKKYQSGSSKRDNLEANKLQRNTPKPPWVGLSTYPGIEQTVSPWVGQTLSPWFAQGTAQPKNFSNHLSYNPHSENFWKNAASPRSYRDDAKHFSISEAANPFVSTSPTWKDVTETSFYTMPFDASNNGKRDKLISSERPKSEQEKLEEQLRADESDADDTDVNFEGICDHVLNQTCWIEREVGDVLTLSVRIESTKKSSSFQIKWFKMYHVFDSKKGQPLEIEPGKMPWNMVIGSEGRELRIHPVTNSDMDPNCIVAKAFLLNKHQGKVLFTLLKKLIFCIDIPIIDMGKLYAGEELSVNIENFISLPERGNMLFDWSMEVKPHHIESLPSNVKVSNTGRSLVLKELKRGRMGVLNCVVYSSSRFAVAKRRFNVLKITDNMKRRSPELNFDDNISKRELRRNMRCRRFIRRSQERTIQRIEEGTKPKSRQKRFRKMDSDISDLDCGLLKKKLYKRWVRSLFGEFPTTSDPRVMPLEKLFALSEEGDGTLDDVIPHEVHYVEPRVKIVTGTMQRSVDQLQFSANCTSDTDCGQNALCVVPQGQKNSTGHLGYCYCRPAFYGDGFTCHKIPESNHREKRLRRHLDHPEHMGHAEKDFSVPEHLFYEQQSKGMLPTNTLEAQEDEASESPVKVLAYEEEESFLLSDCIDDKDCSSHASCVQPSNGHPYCKCRPGYRGNGIFCWEIIDYVPPEEQFFSQDDIRPQKSNGSPEAPMGRLAVSKIPTSEDLADE